MTETMEEMEKRHLQEKAELINNCSHKELGEWISHYYAPQHSSGFKVKLCKNCGVVRQYSGGEVGEKYDDAMMRLDRRRWQNMVKANVEEK